MPCEEIGDRLMAYLDDELSDEERTQMENHLTSCEPCREDIRAYRRMRELSRQLRLREPPPEFWDEYPQGVVNRLGRGIGWMLIIGFGVVLTLYGIGCLWISEVPLLVKACVTGVLLGFGILLLTLVRQRLREAKTDRYKEIIR